MSENCEKISEFALEDSLRPANRAAVFYEQPVLENQPISEHTFMSLTFLAVIVNFVHQRKLM